LENIHNKYNVFVIQRRPCLQAGRWFASSDNSEIVPDSFCMRRRKDWHSWWKNCKVGGNTGCLIRVPVDRGFT
jgi:hypothetical protein